MLQALWAQWVTFLQNTLCEDCPKADTHMAQHGSPGDPSAAQYTIQAIRRDAAGAEKGLVTGELGTNAWRRELGLQTLVRWGYHCVMWHIGRPAAGPQKCLDACMSCLFQHVCLIPAEVLTLCTWLPSPTFEKSACCWP